MTEVAAGRIGKPHGRDGSFWLDGAAADLNEGDEVHVAGRRAKVLRSEGMDNRPLLRLAGLEDRESVAALRGEQLMVEATLADDEWLAGRAGRLLGRRDRGGDPGPGRTRPATCSSSRTGR